MGSARLLSSVTILALGVAGVLYGWHWTVGFDYQDRRWWGWLARNLRETGTLPDAILWPLIAGGAGMVFAVILFQLIFTRAGNTTLLGDRDGDALHGTAKWADRRDVKNAGLIGKSGVVVGGFKKRLGTDVLRHDGPEHVMCFAPTRSGKGVGLVLPTLLSWLGSVLVLDIKGENYALTSGWRESQGQRILKFEPTATSGSVRYNPLREIRIDTGHKIEDCQNIAMMIIDPDGKGLKDFWMQTGFEWLAVVILHVLFRVRRDEGRIASLRDVNRFMSAAMDDDGEGGEDSFNAFLEDMIAFEHGDPEVDDEVRRGASSMRITAHNQRSGTHSSAKVPLALYADPIVSRNIEESDFRLADLMNGDRPASLYIVIPPSDIDRLRPLIRILMNQFLRRLTSSMEFADGRSVQGYKHRLLLMLDEFTSIGKLEIFDQSLAYMAGYGLKCFVIVQDLTQLERAYGKEQSIVANCHIRIAFAPNTVNTAKTLSDMAGKTTIVQKKRSRSGKFGDLVGSTSDSIQETVRPLLTPDECMRLPGLQKGFGGRVKRGGDMLIFPAGSNPIYGRQLLYFKDREWSRRSKMPPPSPAETSPETVEAVPVTDVPDMSAEAPMTEEPRRRYVPDFNAALAAIDQPTNRE